MRREHWFIQVAAHCVTEAGAHNAAAAGMAADIIATPDNPLQNIQTLKKVKFVMKDGREFKRQN